MKYLFAYISPKDGSYLLKLQNDDGKEKWYKATEAVHGYASKSIKKNESVMIEVSNEKGKEVITRITKANTTAEQPQNRSESPSNGTSTAKAGEYTCSECGKKLKDNKYTKCYTCNQKNPVTTTEPSSRQSSIENQAVLKASADAVATAFVGQVKDEETLGDMIARLYKKLRPLV